MVYASVTWHRAIDCHVSHHAASPYVVPHLGTTSSRWR